MIQWLSASEEASYAEPLAKRFGLHPQWLAQHRMLKFGVRRIYIANKALVLPNFQDGTDVEGIGISLLRVQHQAVPKPTFEGAAFLLPYAQKNVLEITDQEAPIVRSGETFKLADERIEGLERGYLLTHLRGVSFGCVHLRDGEVSSYFPKRYSHYNMVE